MRPGEIYHLEHVPPLHGGAPKGRYVVVVTASDDVLMDGPIYVVACTTAVRQEQVDSGHAIALPWSRQGAAMTGFRRPTFAIPDWIVEVRPSQLGRRIGHIPSTKLEAILSKLPPDPMANDTR